MDIREINTILIEPVDELPFESNKTTYQSTDTFVVRRMSQPLQHRSPKATYARPRPPAHSTSDAPRPETKAMRRPLTTEPLVRRQRPTTISKSLVSQQIAPAVTPQVSPAIAQKTSAVVPLKRFPGVSAYLLLLMLLLIGVLGGIGFGYLLSTSQSLPAQIYLPLAHYLLHSHINFISSIRG